MTSRALASLCENYLGQAAFALDAGHLAQCEALAGSAQAAAALAGDTHLNARAHLVLLQSDVLSSRFDQAASRAQRLVDQFRAHDDLPRLCTSLDLWSYSLSALGFTDLADHCVQEGARLRESGTDMQGLAQSLTYTAVVQTWSQDQAGAQMSLEAAEWYAREMEDPVKLLHPLLNKAFTYVQQLTETPCGGLNAAPAEALVRLIPRLVAMRKTVHSEGTLLYRGLDNIAQVLLEFLCSVAQTQRGDLPAAHAHARQCELDVVRLHPNSWARAFPWWARCLLFARSRDFEPALVCAEEMAVVARDGQHMSLHKVAQRLKDCLGQALSDR